MFVSAAGTQPGNAIRWQRFVLIVKRVQLQSHVEFAEASGKRSAEGTLRRVVASVHDARRDSKARSEFAGLCTSEATSVSKVAVGSRTKHAVGSARAGSAAAAAAEATDSHAVNTAAATHAASTTDTGHSGFETSEKSPDGGNRISRYFGAVAAAAAAVFTAFGDYENGDGVRRGQLVQEQEPAFEISHDA